MHLLQMGNCKKEIRNIVYAGNSPPSEGWINFHGKLRRGGQLESSKISFLNRPRICIFAPLKIKV